jgi:hypothetical protein
MIFALVLVLTLIGIGFLSSQRTAARLRRKAQRFRKSQLRHDRSQ